MILASGNFLANKFSLWMFHKLDVIRAFGFGSWFGHSALRIELWNYSWLAFALIPGTLWMVWVRVNREYDWIERKRKLDRPIFNFLKAVAKAIDGGQDKKEIQAEISSRIAAVEARSQARIRELEKELAELRMAYAETETKEPWKE